MPSGGTITIGIDNTVLDETYAMMNLDSRAGAYVKLIVEDTGEGIPPAIRERIFEPFFTTKEIGKGTGLGLSTTMGIIKSHGGFFHLYSEVGVGTKFEIYLPAATSDKAAEDVAVEQTGLPRGHGELILIVDDEDGIRKIVQATLERFGYRVLPAANGAEAVALFVQNRDDVALVLTDMAMPVMDGPATIVALRAISRGCTHCRVERAGTQRRDDRRGRRGSETLRAEALHCGGDAADDRAGAYRTRFTGRSGDSDVILVTENGAEISVVFLCINYCG